MEVRPQKHCLGFFFLMMISKKNIWLYLLAIIQTSQAWIISFENAEALNSLSNAFVKFVLPIAIPWLANL